MASEPEDHQRQIATALMKTIFEQSMIDIGGESTAYVRPIEVGGALVTCLAAIMEQSPTCRTPKGMRETADELGKALHRLMRDMRALRDAGTPTFPGDVIYSN